MVFLNPYIFIFFQKGEVVLWDYKHHQQFFLEKHYIQRLIAFSKEPIYQSDNPIDNHFLQEGILVEGVLSKEIQWGWDVISQIFHIGTMDIPLACSLDDFERFIEEYVQFCESQSDNIAEIITEKKGPVYLLPEPHLDNLDNKTFSSILKERMTSRFFDKKPLSLEEVSQLLYVVFGQIHGPWKQLEDAGLQPLGIRKSSPSAGGLHASEAYILATNITGLPKGIYHYRSHQHVLTQITSEWNESQLGRLLAGQQFAEDLPCGVFITSRFDKLWDKYHHSRGYRVALLDIGHLSQTFHLCATAMGLESWLTGVFLDTEVNQLLNIDNTSEQVMFFVGAGHGKHQFLDEKTLAYLDSSRINKTEKLI